MRHFVQLIFWFLFFAEIMAINSGYYASQKVNWTEIEDGNKITKQAFYSRNSQNGTEKNIVLVGERGDKFVAIDMLFASAQDWNHSQNIENTILQRIKMKLPNVTTIGAHFAVNCPNLSEVDLDLENLKHIGRFFLKKSPNITTFILKSKKLTDLLPLIDCFRQVKESDDPKLPPKKPLKKKLKSVTLDLDNIKTIDYPLFDKLEFLKEVTIKSKKLTTIDSCCFFECPNLKRVTLDCPALVSIKQDAFVRKESLLGGSQNIKKVGIEKIDLSSCIKLTKLPKVWEELRNTSEGKKIVFPKKEKKRKEPIPPPPQVVKLRDSPESSPSPLSKGSFSPPLPEGSRSPFHVDKLNKSLSESKNSPEGENSGEDKISSTASLENFSGDDAKEFALKAMKVVFLVTPCVGVILGAIFLDFFYPSPKKKKRIRKKKKKSERKKKPQTSLVPADQKSKIL